MPPGGHTSSPYVRRKTSQVGPPKQCRAANRVLSGSIAALLGVGGEQKLVILFDDVGWPEGSKDVNIELWKGGGTIRVKCGGTTIRALSWIGT